MVKEIIFGYPNLRGLSSVFSRRQATFKLKKTIAFAMVSEFKPIIYSTEGPFSFSSSTFSSYALRIAS